ncbi:MAG: PhnD/SsuA/transferrin family substrate-binding protein [Chloroflexi bacterium]|nr:PhnD/SsuA/transferrin family substrate-binding protein [Chloroflexota bacterium]
MERATGRAFRLHVTPRDGNVVDEVGAGQVDFAIVGTLSYLQARERFGGRALARGLNTEGEPTYRAAIITRPDGVIRALSDLRGRSFAFGAPNSTQGNLIPRMMLAGEEINLSDLRGYEYTNSHAATASAVVNGRDDAGGMQDTLALALQSRGLVRIVAQSPPYPSSGVMVSATVPEDVAELVRKALLTFDPTGRDASGLYHWDRSEMPRGFAPAQDEDYEVLRQWASSLGLLSR